ncbi:MAG TPA: TatD family hydrolase [Phycisphaerae bacterium]|nr:TatD family hydrolase [Phycisphaerae bacterium]
MPATIIDTHCHLTDKALFERRREVVQDAVRAGVTRMIEVACTPADLEPALQLRKEFPGHVALACGIHPHEAGKVIEAEIERFARLWHENTAVVAVGEIGLDYHYDFSPRDVQRTIFRKQLDLAADTSLPIVIHSREAHDDVVTILRECGYVGRKVVFHCFGGDAAQAAELRSLGWRASFTGVLTFKGAVNIRQAYLETPADMLMFETDCPYMSPEPVRMIRPNEPQYLVHTVRFAASLRGITFEALAGQSTANAVDFFNLAH